MACCADANIDFRGVYYELLQPLGVTTLANPRIVDSLHHRWRRCRHKFHASRPFHAFFDAPSASTGCQPHNMHPCRRIHHIIYLSARALPSGRLAACSLHSGHASLCFRTTQRCHLRTRNPSAPGSSTQYLVSGFPAALEEVPLARYLEWTRRSGDTMVLDGSHHRDMRLDYSRPSSVPASSIHISFRS